MEGGPERCEFVDKMRTRLATSSDARSLAVLHVETWKAAYRGLVPDAFLESLDVDARAEAWKRIVEDESVIVAVRQSQLLGFVSSGDSRDEDAAPSVGELFGLYVHPHAWSTGVGRYLHDLAISALTSAGHREATLWMLQGNQRAHAFYERQGWSPDGAVKTDPRPGVVLEEVRYRRPLT